MNLTTATRWGLNFLALLAVVVLLRVGRDFFIPPVIALLLAALLWPLVRGLNQRLRVPWSIACFIGIIGLIALNVAVTAGFAMSIGRMMMTMPDIRQDWGQVEVYRSVRQQVIRISPDLIDDKYWPDYPGDSRIFNYVKDTVSTAWPDILFKGYFYLNEWAWLWTLIMFFLLFMLLEGRMLVRKTVAIVGPSKEVQSKAGEALGAMAFQVRNYLMWRTIVNAALGVIVGGVYQAMGLKEPWTWALLTAVLCYVPYLGPLLAGIPPLLDAFVSCQSPWFAVVILIFYMGMIVLEGYLVVPVVMGRSMELNATTVMLACLFWELVWGLPGLFLAMPLMAAMKAVCMHIPDLKPWANLMSTHDELGETAHLAGPPSLDGKNHRVGHPAEVAEPAGNE